MAGEYKELHSVLIDGAPRFGTSSAAFDNELELLWVGNSGGHITSYCGANLQKFTSFQVDPTCPVINIETVKDRVLSLTRERLTCHSKNGLKEYEFFPQSGFAMDSALLYKDNTLLIGGKSSSVIEFDLNTGASPLRNFSEDGKMQNGVSIFRSSSRFLCCGDSAGNITLRDHDTLKAQHVFNAHTGTLADFDIHGHLLVSCGYTLRHGMDHSLPQSLAMERTVKVFDTRMMRTVTPIQAHIQPAFVRFIPTYTRRLIIINETGQFLLIEDNAAVTPSTPMYQLNNMCGNVSGFAMSKSMQTLAFGDSGGHMQLWSSSASPTFHQYPKMPEFASIPESLERIDNDFTMPLSMIPMPRCREKLLSDWPSKYCNPVSRRPPPIDPHIIQTMKIVHGIGYAPNPGNRRRNQVPYKLKDMAVQDKMGKKAAVPDSPLGREEQPHLYMVPKKYRKISLKYSKLGFEEDGMIQHYNKTNFAGLDPNILNAYCNSMLQTLYFLQPLRAALLQHHNLEKEFDLAEELGFLFRMQDLSKGGVLQASNFLRAFRTIPEATALGLVQHTSQPEQVGTSTHGNLSQLIQNWNCFILQQLQTELSQVPLKPFEISTDSNDEITDFDTTATEKIFGMKMKVTTKFKNGNESERMMMQIMFTLMYPPPPLPGEPHQPVSFTDIICRSICSKVQTKSWDLNSSTYQPMEQQRAPVSLPEMLALNCGLTREEECQFWKAQTEIIQQMNNAKAVEIEKLRKKSVENNDPSKKGENGNSDAWNVFVEREGLDLSFDQQHKATWVPLSITLQITSNGELKVKQCDTETNSSQRTDETESDIEQEFTYDLYATICHIIDPKTGGNLVAHINVGEKYHQMKEGVTHTQWYLFNDFQICSIDAVEAVDFDLQWKIPAVLYYARREIHKRYDFNVQFPLTPAILSLSESLSKIHPQSPAPTTFTPLMPAELPTDKGMFVALDAEFVTLNNEEAELHSDGTRSTIKPSHLSLARVTVVRGEGEMEGLPFIDDYISTQEQVVDYLTKFSGILPGDLDVSLSSKHLSTLKLTYCKLSYLVHCGCIIIGHGLRKDFKVINIVVPPSQIRDTVSLYHLPRKRFISLRFLAWYFLKTKIQEKNHDSIEDACTALKLYKKYVELTENETQVMKFQQTVLKDMYEEGRKLEWKIPGSDM